MQVERSEVAVVGAGNVGSTFAFCLMISGLAREIVLIDRNEQNKKYGHIIFLNGTSSSWASCGINLLPSELNFAFNDPGGGSNPA